MQGVEPKAELVVPPIVWLLLILGLARMVVQSMTFGFVGYDGELTWGAVVNVLGSSADFLLAAAIVIGASRWPAGRAWLAVAAMGFVLAGLLDLGYGVWFWLNSEAPGILRSIDSATVDALNLRATVAVGLVVVSTILTAVGLVASRARQEGVRQRPLTTAGIGAVGVLAAASSVALLAKYPSSEPLVQLLAGLESLWMLAWTAVAVAALRARRVGDGVPETVIAVGAIGIAAATGFQNWFAWRGGPDYLSSGWTWLGVSLPATIIYLGPLVVAAGIAFGSVRLRAKVARQLRLTE